MQLSATRPSGHSSRASQAPKQRPAQGARLVVLRKAAALSQAELARLIGEPQQNVALWEQSDKPPRSDAIPKLARALGVRVEDLFTEKTSLPRPSGPVGKVRKLFDEVAKLPRRHAVSRTKSSSSSPPSSRTSKGGRVKPGVALRLTTQISLRPRPRAATLIPEDFDKVRPKAAGG